MNDYYVYFYYEEGASEPFYVGAGRGTRSLQHLDPCRLKVQDHFHNKLRCMIAQGQKFEVKIVANGLTFQQSRDLEILFIKEFGRYDLGTGYLCNHTNGGEGQHGRCVSKETRDKMSRSQLGKEISYETRLKRSKLKHSEQSIKKIIESRTEVSGIEVESYNLTSKETIKQYKSLSEAARDICRGKSQIAAVLKGRLKSCGGFGWRHTTKERVIEPINLNSFAYQPFEAEL